MEFTKAPIHELANSVTEEEQQIDAAAFHSLEQLALLRALDEVGLKPQPPLKLVFQHDVGLALIADPLLDVQIDVLPELLAESDLRPLARFGREVDVELGEVERTGDGLRQATRQRTACQILRLLH